MVSEPKPAARECLVGTAMLRENVETNLSDSALERLIDDADATVVRYCGPHNQDGSVEEIFPGGSIRLFPNRAVESVEKVTETVGQSRWTSPPTTIGVGTGAACWRGCPVAAIPVPIGESVCCSGIRRSAPMTSAGWALFGWCSWVSNTPVSSQRVWVHTAFRAWTIRGSGTPS